MKGIYCLIINIKKNIIQEIGSLGKINFKRGSYVYVGSAQNSIEKRVGRHLRKEKTLFWHIDYLLGNKDVEVNRVLVREGEKKEGECRTARKIALFAGGIANFGCSDCQCDSHLFKIENLNNLDKLNFKEYKKQISRR